MKKYIRKLSVYLNTFCKFANQYFYSNSNMQITSSMLASDYLLRSYLTFFTELGMCAEATNCDLLFEHVNKSEDRAELGGYRPDLLVKELTSLEANMLLCKVCGGVKRGDCFRQHEAEKRVSIDPGVEETVDKLRILCPMNDNGCEWVGVILEVSHHLEECEFKPNRCIFSELGCLDQIPRGKIDQHLQDKSNEHLLQMLEQVKKCSFQVERSGIEMEQLRLQKLEMKKEHQSLLSKLNAAEVSNRMRGEGFHWVVSDVSQNIEDSANLWGPYFHLDGYKFQLKLCFGYENKSSLALFMCVVRGDGDDLLQWPFSLESEKFVFSLKNSSGPDAQLLTITTGDSTQAFNRPEAERSLPRGTGEFVSHSDLLSNYCLDNSFTVGVCVRPRTDPADSLKREVQALLRSQDIRGGGYMWRVEAVAQKIENKQNSDNIWGPSFYVGRYLFQPTVRFHCDNRESMGLFIALFKGPYDCDLAWPFRMGSDKFFFSILDHDSCELATKYISLDEKNRDLFTRPIGPRNKAYGCPNLISHGSLTDSLLQDDSITVMIAIRNKY